MVRAMRFGQQCAEKEEETLERVEESESDGDGGEEREGGGGGRERAVAIDEGERGAYGSVSVRRRRVAERGRPGTRRCK